jgi:hypothetical protein
MTNGLGMIIDCLVAILLALTIGYCILLNRRLKLLKSDEHSLRATISELVTATEIAERAIGGLKLTVHECDLGLGERLRKAERVTIEINRSITAGQEIKSELERFAGTERAAAEAAPKRRDAKAVAAAAEAFAERLRTKVNGLAA